jgi:hypothetical protein
VPWERDAVVKYDYRRLPIEHKEYNGKKLTSIYPANLLNNRNRDHYPHGFLIHSRCWTLIERIIGPCAETQLELFTHALYKMWTEQDSGVLNYIKAESTNIDSRERKGWSNRYLFPRTEEARIAVKDPEDIPEIEALFRKSTLRKTGKLRSWRRRDGPIATKSGNLDPKCDLPLEIIYMILDHLYDPDASQVIEAMNWHIHDTYWRSRLTRFSGDIIFEIEQFKLADSLDWQFLCLQIEPLLETSKGLLNRRRILRILIETKKHFQAELRLLKDSELEGGLAHI